MPDMSEEYVDRMVEEEVLEDARDLVAEFNIILQQLRTNSTSAADARTIMLQSASNLRLKAKSVAVPGLSSLSHRMDEYITSTPKIEAQHIEDLQSFADKIAALLEGDNLSSEEVASLVRALPHRVTFDVNDVQITNIEVLVVIPQRSAARVVERELAACGYRVSTVLDPIEALAMILEAKPDLVITSQIMPRLSGVDLACALGAMPTTHKIPIALLTSLEPSHPDLQALPKHAGLIRRGANFGDDLAQSLQRFKIT